MTRPEQRAWLRFAAGVAFFVLLVVALFVAGYVYEQPLYYTCAGLVAIVANIPLSMSVQTYFDRRRELREQEWARADQELWLVRERWDHRVRLTRALEDVVRP